MANQGYPILGVGVVFLDPELISCLIKTLPQNLVRMRVAKSSFWREKVFRGQRPQEVTVDRLLARVSGTVFRTRPQVLYDLTDWWKEAHEELLSAVANEDLSGSWEYIVGRWSPEAIRVALTLSKRHDAEELSRTLTLAMTEGTAEALRQSEREVAATVERVVDNDLQESLKKLRRITRQLDQQRAENRRLKQSMDRVCAERSKSDRKVTQLTKELKLQKEQLRAQRAANRAELAAVGAVVICYPALGSYAMERLRLLAEFYILLGASTGNEIPVSASLHAMVKKALWSKFWSDTETDYRVRINDQPREHILVGTVQLLEDLSEVQHLFTR